MLASIQNKMNNEKINLKYKDKTNQEYSILDGYSLDQVLQAAIFDLVCDHFGCNADSDWQTHLCLEQEKTEFRLQICSSFGSPQPEEDEQILYSIDCAENHPKEWIQKDLEELFDFSMHSQNTIDKQIAEIDNDKINDSLYSLAENIASEIRQQTSDLLKTLLEIEKVFQKICDLSSEPTEIMRWLNSYIQEETEYLTYDEAKENIEPKEFLDILENILDRMEIQVSDQKEDIQHRLEYQTE